MIDLVTGYDRQAAELAELYESLSFEDCHPDAVDLVLESPGLVLARKRRQLTIPAAEL